jgi:glutathione S-transferase
MAIELYVFPPSPRAFKVMAVANHLDLDWTLQFIDLIKGDHKTPQYAALNPNMRIPTLKDGDFVLGNQTPSANIWQRSGRKAG